MKADFGPQSWQRIAYDSRRMRIYDIQLTLNQYASHNLLLPFDGMLFVSDGQMFVQSLTDELSVKANQSLWLPHHQALRCVALSPSCRFFVITFTDRLDYTSQRLQRFTSGTEQKKQLSSGVTLWTAHNQRVAKVEWLMFPAQYQEPLYYLRDAEQFILPVNSAESLTATSSAREDSILIDKDGHVFCAQEAHTLRNTSDRPITFLSVVTPAPRYNRIYKLTR